MIDHKVCSYILSPQPHSLSHTLLWTVPTLPTLVALSKQFPFEVKWYILYPCYDLWCIRAIIFGVSVTGICAIIFWNICTIMFGVSMQSSLEYLCNNLWSMCNNLWSIREIIFGVSVQYSLEYACNNLWSICAIIFGVSVQ